MFFFSCPFMSETSNHSQRSSKLQEHGRIHCRIPPGSSAFIASVPVRTRAFVVCLKRKWVCLGKWVEHMRLFGGNAPSQPNPSPLLQASCNYPSPTQTSSPSCLSPPLFQHPKVGPLSSAPPSDLCFPV